MLLTLIVLLAQGVVPSAEPDGTPTDLPPAELDSKIAKHLTYLADRDPELRSVGLTRLAALGPLARRALPRIRTALKDTDPTVRNDALLAFVSIGTPDEALPHLLKALADPATGDDPATRQLIIDAARQVKGGLAKLQKSMESADFETSKNAGFAVLELEPDELVPMSRTLAKLAFSPTGQMRYVAWEALEKFPASSTALVLPVIRRCISAVTPCDPADAVEAAALLGARAAELAKPLRALRDGPRCTEAMREPLDTLLAELVVPTGASATSPAPSGEECPFMIEGEDYPPTKAWERLCDAGNGECCYQVGGLMARGQWGYATDLKGGALKLAIACRLPGPSREKACADLALVTERSAEIAAQVRAAQAGTPAFSIDRFNDQLKTAAEWNARKEHEQHAEAEAAANPRLMECGYCKATGQVYVDKKVSSVETPVMAREFVTHGKDVRIGTKRTTYESGGEYVTCPRCGGTGKLPY